MSKIKICSTCHDAKQTESDFYVAAGKLRSECKMCIIKRNGKYQKSIDAVKRRHYMREYQKKNREKFAKYMAAFKLRYPDYYQEYYRNRRRNKLLGESSPNKT